LTPLTLLPEYYCNCQTCLAHNKVVILLISWILIENLGGQMCFILFEWKSNVFSFRWLMDSPRLASMSSWSWALCPTHVIWFYALMHHKVTKDFFFVCFGMFLPANLNFFLMIIIVLFMPLDLFYLLPSQVKCKCF
jgi:hypothetical protein